MGASWGSCFALEQCTSNGVSENFRRVRACEAGIAEKPALAHQFRVQINPVCTVAFATTVVIGTLQPLVVLEVAGFQPVLTACAS